MKIHGILTSKDIAGHDRSVPIEKVMTKNPVTVIRKTSVASAAQMMVWEGIEVLPVTDGHHKLIGMISRQDVLKALQMVQSDLRSGKSWMILFQGDLKKTKMTKRRPFINMKSRRK